jgi:hypothetical protein
LIPRMCVLGTIFSSYFFLLALMDLAWSQVFIALVFCYIGCPVFEAGFFLKGPTE